MLFRRVAPNLQLKGQPAKALQPGDLIEVDGRPVRLAVNARARRIGLRLHAGRREVVATAPSARRLAEAAAFAHSRSAWIALHLDRLPKACTLRPGAVIEVLGAPCRLERAAMRIKPRLIAATADDPLPHEPLPHEPLPHEPLSHEPRRLLAPGEGEAFARACVRALRAHALQTLADRTTVHCRRLGVPSPRLAIGDARGRWGSCRQASAAGPAVIRYSWRLILTPPEVLDYVAAHECAHLIEANHGPRFWAVVQSLCGDPAGARTWLKQNGARLHAVGRG